METGPGPCTLLVKIEKYIENSSELSNFFKMAVFAGKTQEIKLKVATHKKKTIMAVNCSFD